MIEDRAGLEEVLAALRAVAEPSRFRLLSLCAQGDLTVSDMVEILGQSQPGVSRHLKVLCDAGLVDRYRDGAWVFYRLAAQGAGASVARRSLGLISADDHIIQRDNTRLAAIKRTRADAAAAYFDRNATQWAGLRSLHIDETEVEAAILAILGAEPLGAMLDVGTGTGRILELLAPKAEIAEGVDRSREMLALARSRIQAAGLRNCLVRSGDMYHLPFDQNAFDVVTIHQVLHFADDPEAAIAESARVLRSKGRLLVVDFAPHSLEELRDKHSHRRLGFAKKDVIRWSEKAGLTVETVRVLPGSPLTVILWLARRV
jgi:ArsR family transcriptional regulator